MDSSLEVRLVRSGQRRLRDPLTGFPSRSGRLEVVPRPWRARGPIAGPAGASQLRWAAPAGVGVQIVVCDPAHLVPDTGRIRFSSTFVGEPGSSASLRHLGHCVGGTSGVDADAGLAWIISFRQEPPSGPVWPDATNECAKQQRIAGATPARALAAEHRPLEGGGGRGLIQLFRRDSACRVAA